MSSEPDREEEARSSEVGDSGAEATSAKPAPKKTRQKGSSTDSSGGRGESDDDEADDFEDASGSQAALDAEQTVQEIERQRSGTNDDGYDVEKYAPGDAEEWRSLSDIDASHGNSMSAKEVAVIEDETKVVHTDLDNPTITVEDAERQLVGSEWLQEIDSEMRVAHNADLDEGWYATEVAPGVDAKNAIAEGYASEVDADTFRHMAATQVIIGNTDAHQNNVRVDENSNLYPFDLDRAAGDVDGEWVGKLTQYSDTQDRILGELEKTASALNVEMDREAVMDEAASIAADVDGLEPLVEGSEWNAEMSKTIQSNVDSLSARASNQHPSTADEYDPQATPEIRQGTDYERFTSEEMTAAAANAMQDNNIGKRRWAEWNDFFDHMTDTELEEAAILVLSKDVERDEFGSSPEYYEPGESTVTDQEASLNRPSRRNLASCLTRIGRDDLDRQREFFDRLTEEAVDDERMTAIESGAMWLRSSEVRREIYEEHDLGSEAEHPRRFTLQFGDDHEERAEIFINNYAGSTGSAVTQISRASLIEYGPNEDTDISNFNKQIAAKGIEPTEEFSNTIDRLRNDTSEYIKEEHDGEITLERGLTHEITANASAESWTTNSSTASDFDGHAVMKATFQPGQVISAYAIEQHSEWGYHRFSQEEEWTVLGGPLAENVPDNSTAAEYYAESNTDEPREI